MTKLWGYLLLVCCLFSESYALDALKKTSRYTLRQKSANHEIRIVNGIKTSVKNYDWMVAISAASKSYVASLICGGSLLRDVNPPIVVTAAHCIDGVLAELKADTGEDFTMYATLARNDVTNDDETGYITVPWKDSMYHQNYNKDTFENDIAVVLLDYKEGISSKEIVELYTNTSECCNDGDLVRVLGYGMKESNTTITGYLEYADLQYVPVDICNKWFYLWYYYKSNGQQDPYTYDFSKVNWDSVTADKDRILPGMICAYAKTQDACQGDSGGPLIKGTTKDSLQVGVVSWGTGCADNIPGVYTSVGYYIEWIWAASSCLLNDNGDSSYESDCLNLNCAEQNGGNAVCFQSGWDPTRDPLPYDSSSSRAMYWISLCIAFGVLSWML